MVTQSQVNIQSDLPDLAQYQALAEQVLKRAKALGATQAELSLNYRAGFSVNVRMGEVETLEYHRDSGLVLTIYDNQKKGSASTTDLGIVAVEKAVSAACHIAKLTQEDPASGLAEREQMAVAWPDLDLCHPWDISPTEGIALAQCCEAKARSVDSRIHNAEGTGVATTQARVLYANSHGFVGSYLKTRHSLHCFLVVKDKEGNMQRDGSYTVSRNPQRLREIEPLALEAGERTVSRLGARRLKTCQSPVIFQAEVASNLIACFLQAISGGALYRKRSFLLDQLYQPVFSDIIQIQERPHIPQGLASAPFDVEGVRTGDRDLIKDGLLQGYLLGSYSARRLGMLTTGNAGGAHNVIVNSHVNDLSELLQQMDTGLLVTELMGNGVNLLTGDYSQGASGFWVEKGQIQYPVEEITIASNLREMYRGIIAIAGDIDTRSAILTGSILIDLMTISGE